MRTYLKRLSYNAKQQVCAIRFEGTVRTLIGTYTIYLMDVSGTR